MKSRVIISAVVFILALSFSYASADVPQMINYQGKLTTPSGALIDDTVSMTFAIYDDSTGGTALWSETQPTVVVEYGIFSVILGDVNPIPWSVFNGTVKYLGVKVGTDSEMTPRKAVVSVGYAYKTEFSDTAEYARTAPAMPDADWTINGDTIYHLNGNVGIGSASPNEQLEITGNLRLPTTTTATGIIKVGADRFIHNYGTNNTFVGENAGNLTMSGTNNTAVGYQALYSNTTGYINTANGVQALHYNTEGHHNTANGSWALYHNTTGYNNTANGYYALYSNTEGYENTANGSWALRQNTTGDNNTANGYYALYGNTTGDSNTAVGCQALYSNTTGFNNTANGSWALRTNTTGDNNTANGVHALHSNIDGWHNTATGSNALYSNTTGDNNTAYGSYALYYNIDGRHNTAIGSNALASNSGGEYNTATGFAALSDNNDGDNNTATGSDALSFNTDGYKNTATGTGALSHNIAGYQNTATGNVALYFNSGYRNTAIGSSALYSNTGGHNNTALGYAADVSSGDFTNATAIGAAAVVDASNKVRIGNTSVTSIGGQVGWTTFSDGRYKKSISQNVPGLSFINKLKPVTYTMDVDAIDAALRPSHKSLEGQSEEDFKLSAEDLASKQAQSQIVYTGFIAQEVEQAAQELGYAFSGIDAPKNDKGMYGLRYSEFVVPLVKAVQEQQEIIKEQQAQINALKAEIEELKSKR